MCLLILLRDVDPDYPLIVASNRDEFRGRKASPPGLFVGESHRMLSPRDRVGGGTWMALSDAGLFAGLTNVSADPAREDATTRGELPHLAADQDDVGSAVSAVVARVRAGVFNSFRLLVATRAEAAVVEYRGGEPRTSTLRERVLVLTNEHGAGELRLPASDALAEAPIEFADRVAALQRVLLDEGDWSGHRVFKKGGEYGTVSSSVLALPGSGRSGLHWWYAAGEADETPYRDYGNLAKRLQ